MQLLAEYREKTMANPNSNTHPHLQPPSAATPASEPATSSQVVTPASEPAALSQVVTPALSRGLAPRTQQKEETRHNGSQDECAVTERERVAACATAVRAQLPNGFAPRVALVLGSGLGEIAGSINPVLSAPYSALPYLNASTAPGHAGQLVCGTWGSSQVPVVCMQGRLHCYEGNTPAATVLPVYVMAALGASILVCTNASGAIEPSWEVGDIMAIADHINATGTSPLTLEPGAVVSACFDMTDAYDASLRAQTLAIGDKTGAPMREGVYVGVRGPQFETPAEIRMYRGWGADAVGMSTVHEVIAARGVGMRVLGLSVVTNMAAGVLPEPVSVDDVLDASQRACRDLTKILDALVPTL
jgi:purine-nucleoside phosphorylase